MGTPIYSRPSERAFGCRMDMYVSHIMLKAEYIAHYTHMRATYIPGVQFVLPTIHTDESTLHLNALVLFRLVKGALPHAVPLLVHFLRASIFCYRVCNVNAFRFDAMAFRFDAVIHITLWSDMSMIQQRATK